MEEVSSALPEPLVVRAKFAFKGKNNDELCFRKHDHITVTQKLDGGWWEGTLNEKTGWFPKNYVLELTEGERHLRRETKSPAGLKNCELSLPSSHSNKTVYRNMVLKDLFEAEQAHVNELQGLFQDILKPLEIASLLNKDEYNQLVGNIEHIIHHQLILLQMIESDINKPSLEQKVGSEFMKMAGTLKTLLKIYCENHPLAVEILRKRRSDLDSFVISKGSAMKNLVSGLSKPFRHLDKYPTTLQELERNMEKRLLLSGLKIKRVENAENIKNCDPGGINLSSKFLLEFYGDPLVDDVAKDSNSGSILASFSSADEINRWIEAFQSADGVILDESCTTISPTEPSTYDTVQGSLSPSIKPQVSVLPGPGHAELVKKASGIKLNHDMQMIEPEPADIVPNTPTAGVIAPSPVSPTPVVSARQLIRPSLWSGYSLRPYPPPRGNFAVDPEKNRIQLRRKDKPPTSASTKGKMEKWLKEHRIAYDPAVTKTQLYRQKIQPIRNDQCYKKYYVDEMAKEKGVEVLRLPPYHCIFNPIGIIHTLRDHLNEV